MEQEMNEKKTPASPKGEEPKAAAPAKSNFPMLIGILVAVLLFEAVLGIVIVKAAAGPKAAPVASQEDRPKSEPASPQADDGFEMGATTAQAPIEVVVNIAGTEGDRFLKASLIFEYKDREELKAGEKGKAAASPLADALMERMPKYKSFLMDQLSKMSLPELSAPGARDKIRKDMIRLANATLPAKLGWVKNVYFTEYIIQ